MTERVKHETKTKELTITASITLPDDQFDAADVVHNVRAPLAAAEAALTDALGQSFKFAVAIGNQRKRSRS
jgi:hypothetical protein